MKNVSQLPLYYGSKSTVQQNLVNVFPWFSRMEEVHDLLICELSCRKDSLYFLFFIFIFNDINQCIFVECLSNFTPIFYQKCVDLNNVSCPLKIFLH